MTTTSLLGPTGLLLSISDATLLEPTVPYRPGRRVTTVPEQHLREPNPASERRNTVTEILEPFL